MPDVYAKENLFKIEGAWIFGANSKLAPVALAAQADDYDPTGWRDTGVIQVTGLILDSDGNNDFTGLAAPSPAASNMVYIYNSGITGGSITLVSNSGSSLAANRFDFNGNTTLQAGEGLWVVYSTTDSRWNEIARAV
jgi:hypothetical protein